MTAAPFALALAAGVPLALLTGIRGKVVAYFLVLPLVGWFEIRNPGSSIGGIPDVLALLILVQVGWDLVTRRLELPVRHPLVVLAGAFVLLVLLQSQNPIIGAAGGGLSGARVYLEPFALFVGGLVFWQRPANARLFLQVVLITAVLSGLYTLKQLVLGFDGDERAFFAARAGSLVIQEKKLFSTLLAPDVYGFVAAFFLLAALTALAMRIWPRVAAVAAVLSAVGVVTSGLRIALVGVVLGGLVLLRAQLRDDRTRGFATRLLIVGVAVAAVLVSLIVATPAPSDRRTFEPGSAWSSALSKFALLKEGRGDVDIRNRLERTGRFIAYERRHPWGTGPGVVKLLSFETDACLREPGPCFRIAKDQATLPEYVRREPFIFQHDFFYFSTAVELGLLGLVLLVSVLGGAAFVAWRVCRTGRRGPTVHDIAGLVAGGLVLALVHGLTNEAFRTAQVAGYAWFLAGAAAAFASTPVLSDPLRRALPRALAR